uniref:Uncharacterized protein n=1 Tax=Anopheles funestus TaxID=62324 RepID=A0A182S1K5_ANOFN
MYGGGLEKSHHRTLKNIQPAHPRHIRRVSV